MRNRYPKKPFRNRSPEKSSSESPLPIKEISLGDDHFPTAPHHPVRANNRPQKPVRAHGIYRPHRPSPIPPYIAAARNMMAESGVIIVVYAADQESRSILSSPRIESRGFFLPHEARDGHRILLARARSSYEDTLRDVPDIEIRDLERIIKQDIEKTMSETFGRTGLIIPLIELL